MKFFFRISQIVRKSGSESRVSHDTGPLKLTAHQRLLGGAGAQTPDLLSSYASLLASLKIVNIDLTVLSLYFIWDSFTLLRYLLSYQLQYIHYRMSVSVKRHESDSESHESKLKCFKWIIYRIKTRLFQITAFFLRSQMSVSKSPQLTSTGLPEQYRPVWRLIHTSRIIWWLLISR